MEKLKKQLEALKEYLDEPNYRACAPVFFTPEELAEINNTQPSFTDAVLGMIDKKGLKDSDVYKKADVSRSVFGNVKNGHFSRGTAIALALTLELTLAETQELLARGGITLSSSSKFDKTIMYCVLHKIYEADDVNYLLNQTGQPILREIR